LAGNTDQDRPADEKEIVYGITTEMDEAEAASGTGAACIIDCPI